MLLLHVIIYPLSILLSSWYLPNKPAALIKSYFSPAFNPPVASVCIWNKRPTPHYCPQSSSQGPLSEPTSCQPHPSPQPRQPPVPVPPSFIPPAARWPSFFVLCPMNELGEKTCPCSFLCLKSFSPRPLCGKLLRSQVKCYLISGAFLALLITAVLHLQAPSTMSLIPHFIFSIP